MKIILYTLLILLALLNLSNVLAIYWSGYITSVSLGMGTLVLLGAILSLLGAYGFSKRKSWSVGIISAGLALTFLSGVLSIFGSLTWASQLVLPVIAFVLLRIVKK